MTTRNTERPASTPGKSAGRLQLSLLALAVVPLVIVCWNQMQAQPVPQAETLRQQAPATTAAAPAPTSETVSVTPSPLVTRQEQQLAAPDSAPVANSLREQLLGSWEDEFYGHRIFTFRDDGTATMTLELDSVGKALYGPKLTFFIDWELKDDLLTLQMTGGEPAGTAVSLAKLFGDRSERRIERITHTELDMRSTDTRTLYHHRRVSLPN